MNRSGNQSAAREIYARLRSGTDEKLSENGLLFRSHRLGDRYPASEILCAGDGYSQRTMTSEIYR